MQSRARIVIRSVIGFLLLLATNCILRAQYTWYIDPSAIISPHNLVDQNILDDVPVANFDIDWDVPPDSPPRLVGNNLEVWLDASGKGFFQIGEGGLTIGGEAEFDYGFAARVVLLPTPNRDEVVVALQWKKDRFGGWTAASLTKLWRVNKNNPTRPLSVATTSAPPPTGGNAEGYDDDNLNGLDDYFDERFDEYYLGYAPANQADYDDDLFEVFCGDPIFLEYVDDWQNDQWET